MGEVFLVQGTQVGTSSRSAYCGCFGQLPGLVIFENLSTSNPNFSAKVIKLGENSFGVPFSHQHFSRSPTAPDDLVIRQIRVS